MKKTTHFFTHLLIILAFGLSGVYADDIQAVGKKIAADKQSNAIYQADINGVKIAYKLLGSGEPLVMIMGLGATMDAWPQELTDLLSKEYQLILFDNRGMGHSTANETKFTYTLFAEDVLALMDKLEIKKAHVLGYSMGSVITQELLLSSSERFKKAIIYASSTDGLEVTKNLEGRLPNHPIVKRQFEASKEWKTPLEKLSLVENHVMFIVGTSDLVVGTIPTKTMATTIPNAWMLQFKNAGHSLINQAPVKFAKSVLFFLQMQEIPCQKSPSKPSN